MLDPQPLQLSQRLFKMFDTSQLGEICLDDFLVRSYYFALGLYTKKLLLNDVQVNLAVIIKGTEEQKAKFLFQFYDSESKGKLYLSNLVKYQCSIATNRRVSVRQLERQVEDIWKFASEVLEPNTVQDKETLLLEEWVAYYTHSFVQENKKKVPLLSWLSSLSDALQPSPTMGMLVRRIESAEKSSFMLVNDSNDISGHLSNEEKTSLFRWLKSLKDQSSRGILDKRCILWAIGQYLPESIASNMYRICDPWNHGILDERLFARLVSLCCKGSEEEKIYLTFTLFHPDPFLFSKYFEHKKREHVSRERWASETAVNALADLFVMETATRNRWIDPTQETVNSKALNDLQVKLRSPRRKVDLFVKLLPHNEVVDVTFHQFQQLAESRTALVRSVCFAFSLIIRVDSGIRPESRDEEREIISSCHVDYDSKKPGKKGTKWYIIPKKWWNSWCDYVKWSNSNAQDVSSPGMIDNSSLLEGSFVPRMRSDINVEKDIKLVSSRVWKALSRWYSGSPPMPRFVVRVPNFFLRSTASLSLQLELDPVILVIRRYDSIKDAASGSPLVKNVSKYLTVQQLYNIVCDDMRTSRDNSRLWYRTKLADTKETSDFRHKGKLSHDPGKFYWNPLLVTNRFLGNSRIFPSAEVLVEVRLKDGSWPLMGWSEEPQEIEGESMTGTFDVEDEEESFLGAGNDSDIECLDEDLSTEEYRTRRAETVSQLLFVVNSALEYANQDTDSKDTVIDKSSKGSEATASLLGTNSTPHKRKTSVSCTTNLKDVKQCYSPLVRPRAGSQALSRHLHLKLQHYPGHVGLRNLGNTCYMNASLQCLLNTRLLVLYFLSRRFVQDINPGAKFGHNGFMAAAFFELCMEVWTSRAKALSPIRFKDIVASLNSMFQGQGQHDAHELLEFVLNGLAEDLNRNEEKPYIEQRDSDGRQDEIVAAEWWLTHLKRELSIVATLFSGQYKSTLVCDHCNQASCRFEPFTVLQVPLPSITYRYIKVLLVFWNNARPPVYVSVRIRTQTTVREIKKALEQCQPGLDRGVVLDKHKNRDRYNPVPQDVPQVKISAAELYVTRPHKVTMGQELLDGVLLNKNPEEDTLIAYQLPTHKTVIESAHLRRAISQAAWNRKAMSVIREKLSRNRHNSKVYEQLVNETAVWFVDAQNVPFGVQRRIEQSVMFQLTRNFAVRVNQDCCVGVEPSKVSRVTFPSPMASVSFLEAICEDGFPGSSSFPSTDNQPSSVSTESRKSGSVSKDDNHSLPKPAAPIHVVARHANWEMTFNHFLNPLRRNCFDFPKVIRVSPDETTVHELYVMVWDLSKRLIRKNFCPQSNAAVAATSHCRYLESSGEDVTYNLDDDNNKSSNAEKIEGEAGGQCKEAKPRMAWDPDIAAGVDNLSTEDIFDIWGFALKVVNRGMEFSHPGSDNTVDTVGEFVDAKSFKSSSAAVAWAHTSDGVLLRPYRAKTLGSRFRIYPVETDFKTKTGTAVYQSLAKQLQKSLVCNDEDHCAETVAMLKYLSDSGMYGKQGGMGFSEGTNVIIEWDPLLFSRNFDRQAAKEVHDHSSVLLHREEETQAITLSQCLDSFSQWEYLDDEAFCKNCSRSEDGNEITLRKHSKKLEIFRAPPVLIVQLKRFHDNLNDDARLSLHQKLTNLVEFPRKRLNLDEFMAKTSIAGPRCDCTYWEWLGGKRVSDRSGNNSDRSSDFEEDLQKIHGEEADESRFRGVPLSLRRSNAVYDLYGVVNHHGAMGAGHYTAFVKSPISGEWLEYNDDIVMKRGENSVVTSAAYLLFYSRRDIHTASLEEVFPPRKDGKAPVDLHRLQKSMQSSKSCSLM